MPAYISAKRTGSFNAFKPWIFTGFILVFINGLFRSGATQPSRLNLISFILLRGWILRIDIPGDLHYLFCRL
jgi:hypothetical protein